MQENNYIREYCTGCGLCHSAIGKELITEEHGFPYVHIKEGEDTGFFKNVCPVYYYENEKDQDVWGKVSKAFVGYSSDKYIRHKAASGGALTEICIYLLENKIIDGVIHVTYNAEDQTKTDNCISTTIDEIIARCGSRYSISVPLYDILEKLEPQKRYAFVGKPCDVMALRRYIHQNQALENQILYLLSFFCAGEPSRKAQENLLQGMGCSIEECESITYRGNGWPGFTTVKTKAGEQLKMEYKNSWGKYLGRDIRNICRFCLDGTGDAADIVCADFWHLDEQENPDFSEHEGRNIIISRNNKGTDLLNDVVNSGRLFIESDFTDKMESQFYKYQPAQYKRKGCMRSMILALKLCGRPTPRYNKSLMKKYASNLSFKLKKEYFIGTIKRVCRGKI